MKEKNNSSTKKQKFTHTKQDVFWAFIGGVIIAFVVAMFFWGIRCDERIRYLGEAICEEEYDATYAGYSKSRGLQCNEVIDLDYYDGVKVVVNSKENRR